MQTWGRWEGTDRDQDSLEMDIVTRLTTGAMLHRSYVRDLHRLARSGYRWAHEALEPGSFLLYVAAGGFAEGFGERAWEDGLPVVCWSLADLLM